MTGPHDDLEARLQAGFRAPLPGAPASLFRHLDNTQTLAPVRTRVRAGRVLVSTAFVAVVAVAVAVGVVLGPLRSPSAGASLPTTAGWHSYPIDLGNGQAAVTDLFATTSGFVGIVWRQNDAGGSTDLVRSADGSAWERLDPPTTGFVAATGTVVDGELHILGYTGSFDAPVWWHYATKDGRTWREIGKVTGLPTSTFVLELKHAEVGWLARIAVHEISGQAAAARSELRFSADGLNWVQPTVPVRGGTTFYTGVESDGQSLLVLRYDEGEDLTTTEAIVSADGQRWTSHVVSEIAGGPRFVAFDGKRFVAVGEIIDGLGAGKAAAAAWWSNNGSTWTSAAISNRGQQTPDDLGLVLSTGIGFVALGETVGDVWVSTDGTTWTQHAALPTERQWSALSVAVVGDTIVVGDYLPDEQPGVQIGRLSELAHP